MSLTSAQFSKLIENYAAHIIDGMDTDALELMAFDLLVREYETYTQEQVLGEIEEHYGDGFVNDLVEDASEFVPV